jgi:hypothetical protein
VPTSTFWVALRAVGVLGALAAPAALLALRFPAVATCGAAAAAMAYWAVRRRAGDRRRTRFHRHRAIRNAQRAMFAAGAAAGSAAALAGPVSWTGRDAAIGRGLVGAGVGLASALVGLFLIMVTLLIAAEREIAKRPGRRQ